MKKITFFFCIALAYLYLWPFGRRYFRSDVQVKNFVFCFALLSLIRNFAT